MGYGSMDLEGCYRPPTLVACAQNKLLFRQGRNCGTVNLRRKEDKSK